MLTSNGHVLDESRHRLGELRPVPERVRDDRAELWRRLRRDGYLYLPGLLDADVVRDFRRTYFEAVAAAGLLDPATDPAAGRDSGGQVDLAVLRRILYRDVVPGDAYARFCSQPALRGWFARLYDDPVFLHRRKIIRHVRPGERGVGTATQAHYDLVYLREGTDRLLSAWIPLGDCPVPRGPLIYLEGSHRVFTERERAGQALPAASMTADLPRLADEHDARWLVTGFAAGDVMVHSPYLVHASLDNTDPDGIIRLSTDIRYQRAGDPIDWRWQQHWHDLDGL
ncbi:1-deoxypentalenic acid 11-beta-hydroxylase [Streptomyces sp. RB5]|uniref:1-deoxypentalenic acid 11-beta-hydroxylase n=1 Tax=Streptomyces smaragdinus TaxID=2585196 RepID=A0A7K0CAQ7_9ACTN|nr:phytanoyl-CoA dioxygenase family protein [Streptomyces smaragdinus]MQY10486.1 1-deoxypentalenic acid 11-beta-hydroxylase [Streptomyces smaragdinus]